MASLYHSARTQLLSAESEWRAAPRPPFNLDEQLDRMPHWLSAVIIMAIGAALWLTIIFVAGLLRMLGSLA